jgi:transcriptional regulator with XRE-family HTH domain
MCPPRVPRNRSAAFVRALGASIRARRMRLELTRVELARRTRLSETRIIEVEDGDPDVDLLQLVAIAAALEISLRRLLRRAERRLGWVNPEGNEGVTTKRKKPKRWRLRAPPRRPPSRD